MPGRNYAFPQCTSSDYKPKHGQIKHFQIPIRKDEFYTNWGNALTNVFGKYRPLNSELRSRILKGNVCICERHFAPEDLELTSKFNCVVIHHVPPSPVGVAYTSGSSPPPPPPPTISWSLIFES